MMVSSTQTLDLASFLKLPEVKPANEFINGSVIQKPMPKGRRSRLQAKLTAAINEVTEVEKIAYAFPELRCTFGERSIVPDITIFQWDRIPFSETGDVPDNFEIAPDWTIEILSPAQQSNRVIGNILHSLQYGSTLGWLIEPDDLSILVLQATQQPTLCYGDDLLPVLGIVPLELTVNQVFGWLKMGR